MEHPGDIHAAVIHRLAAPFLHAALALYAALMSQSWLPLCRWRFAATRLTVFARGGRSRRGSWPLRQPLPPRRPATPNPRRGRSGLVGRPTKRVVIFHADDIGIGAMRQTRPPSKPCRRARTAPLRPWCRVRGSTKLRPGVWKTPQFRRAGRLIRKHSRGEPKALKEAVPAWSWQGQDSRTAPPQLAQDDVDFRVLRGVRLRPRPSR